MKTWHALVLIMLSGIFSFNGCGHYIRSQDMGSPARSVSLINEGDSVGSEINRDRRLIWNATLVVIVSDPIEDARRAAEIAVNAGGYVDRMTEGERSSLRLRVPMAVFNDTIDGLSALGKVDYKQISAEDVTMQMIDLEARLNNSIALRDRLQLHLDRAESVKDILAIESELSRVQANIESMEASLKSLRDRVDLATINLTLERRTILGPVGYLFKGLFWGIEKLFVIQ